MDNIIELNNITKTYSDKPILNSINLKIKKGEFITVIGRSGCGKTTMLKLINGLVKPDKGKILVEGYDISNIDIIKLRRKIGYVIQEIGLFPHMNIGSNISYVLNLERKKNKKIIKERTEKMIESVGLSKEILNRYPYELSGGQRQRVGIARALAAKPNIILMDEPFGAVDEITRKFLQNEIIDLYKKFNLTIIFITHDIKEALKLGSKVIVMNKGNIIQYDTPENIVEHPTDEFVRKLVGK